MNQTQIVIEEMELLITQKYWSLIFEITIMLAF